MGQKINKFDIFDDNRGCLLPIEFNNLPFTPKRIFTVYDVPKNSVRGEHAHFKTIQILICISGKIEVVLHDGDSETKTIINKGDSILVNNLIWDSQKFISKNSILLVICSTEYDKNDYIYDFNEFLKIKNEIKK
jgi:dTDP-4-dehydrorhamnose 3,5-epimerase-like enzyme